MIQKQVRVSKRVSICRCDICVQLIFSADFEFVRDVGEVWLLLQAH